MQEGRTFENFAVGNQFESDARTVTEADIRLFVGAAGSTYPAHVDHEYCADHPLVDGVKVYEYWRVADVSSGDSR